YTDWEQLKDGYLYQKMIADVVGDYFFICPSIHFAQLFADRGMKVYYYFFTQEISGGGNLVRSKFDELWKTMLISVCQAMLYKANSVSQVSRSILGYPGYC
ncbi:acetylcholinesterase, partial [Vespula squamosa]